MHGEGQRERRASGVANGQRLARQSRGNDAERQSGRLHGYVCFYRRPHIQLPGSHGGDARCNQLVIRVVIVNLFAGGIHHGRLNLARSEAWVPLFYQRRRARHQRRRKAGPLRRRVARRIIHIAIRIIFLSGDIQPGSHSHQLRLNRRLSNRRPMRRKERHHVVVRIVYSNQCRVQRDNRVRPRRHQIFQRHPIRVANQHRRDAGILHARHPEERILVFRLIDDDAQRPGLLGVVDFPIPQAIPPQDECDRSVERAVGQRSASEPVVAQLRNIAQWRCQLAAGGFWAVAEQRVDAR